MTREATSTEVSDLRKENTDLKQLVAEMVLENRLLKKNRDGLRLGGRHVRLTAAEKQEMIRLVEGSDLPVRHTLRELQVPRGDLLHVVSPVCRGWAERAHPAAVGRPALLEPDSPTRAATGGRRRAGRARTHAA